jgi:hypothetical protein
MMGLPNPVSEKVQMELSDGPGSILPDSHLDDGDGANIT